MRIDMGYKGASALARTCFSTLPDRQCVVSSWHAKSPIGAVHRASVQRSQI